MNDKYYWSDGKVRWTFPVNVEHLILQLHTLDPTMKVGSVLFIDTAEGRKPRAFGVSMSFERWGEDGWLDFKLPVPKCLAIWASAEEDNTRLARLDEKERLLRILERIELSEYSGDGTARQLAHHARTHQPLPIQVNGPTDCSFCNETRAAIAAAAKSEVGR